MMEGVKVALEGDAVKFPPTRYYPSKGRFCDGVRVCFWDECDTVRLSAGTIAEAAVDSWSKTTSVGRNQNEDGNGGCCRSLLQRCARKTPWPPE